MISVSLDDGGQLDRLARDLGYAGRRILDKGVRATASSGARVEAIARRRAPVDTGELQASISAGQVQRGDGSVSVTVTATADHAGFVERGTSKMRPQPYLGPALDLVAGRYEAQISALADPF